MNLTYFKFLFVNTIKRKPIWITWFLFLFTCTCFLIILPLAATINTLQVWSNTTMSICQTFMGMVAGLFTAVLAINIFKDTNEEGTELIVISKPISRFNIVLSKFLLFGAYCLMINLTTVLISCFTAFLPRTEPQFYGGLLISMFIGNLITFGIFGSISILLTLKFAKVGIIITNVLISLIFLIYQALTLFVFPTPINELQNQNMSCGTYITHVRDSETGDYTENDLVCFSASAPEKEEQHPCQAKTWEQMMDYWKNNIKAVDPTPTINLTDLASQLSLTYMSVGVDKFAERQAKRMFAMTRYYDYNLISPASPELYEVPMPEGSSKIQWTYYGYSEIPVPWGSETYLVYVPQRMGFDCIPPMASTKLRGYADKIPVGYVKSKELFSLREVFLEKDDWKYYAPAFDAMYDAIYDYRNYTAFVPQDYSNLTTSFANVKNQDQYYKIIWGCFMGKANQYLNEDVYKESSIKEYDKTFFRINNVNDLNDRFIQYKNYACFKAYQEQSKMLNGNREAQVDEYERAARLAVGQQLADSYALLGAPVNVSETGHWYMVANPLYGDNAIIDKGSRTPCVDYIIKTWQQESQNLPDDPAQKIKAGLNSSWSIYKKTGEIFETTAKREEQYLFASLDEPTRRSENTGSAYTSSSNWLPNIHSLILGNVDLPIGQNMQWFNYIVTPRIQYWIFALVWGSIAAGLFATGIVLYNKFDVK